MHMKIADEFQKELRPIASLISKSEKVRQKLAPGTWQYTMLQENQESLRIASALMAKEADNTARPTRNDLQAALRAFASMISKARKAQAKFPSGTSQHTLLQNRLKAFNMAKALIKLELETGLGCHSVRSASDTDRSATALL